MDAHVIGGPIGSAAKYDVKFSAGQLVAELDVNEGVFVGGLVVKLDAGKVLDALAAAIPGVIDDAVIAIVKNALLK